MQRRPPLPLIIIVLLLIVSAAVYFIYFNKPQTVSTALTASGTVETTTIVLAPEISGKVLEVKVNEGDTVKAGDVLFQLDGSLLNAQRDVALANLESVKAAVTTTDKAVASAQSQYDATLSTALADDKANRIAGWTQAKPSDFNQSSWYFNRSEQNTALQSEASVVETALTAAQNNMKFVLEKATSGDFIAAEQRLLLARVSYQSAQIVLDRANTATDGQDLKDEAQNAMDDAKSELTDAQKAYDDAITTEGAKDVLQARAKLQVAQERFDTVNDRLRALETGPLSPKVVSAQKGLDQVTAAAEQARLAVNQAEANVKLLDAQIAKLTIVAPADGTILLRNVEPGEVVNPGSNVLSLGQLTHLTITVYISEDRYGEVSLGQALDVKIDSFPADTFTASVINISDKAEFTPRNVQTTDGRKSTVFAIKLSVANPDGKLKPGMPADVTFK